MKKPFCCDSSRDFFDQYYARQQRGWGSDVPVYTGVVRQRGHGIGNILASLFRRILPFIGRGAVTALRTGADVVDDVTKGQNFKQSLKQRVPEGIKSFASSFVNQSGSGARKRKSVNVGNKQPKRQKTRRGFRGGKRRVKQPRDILQ